MLWDELAGALGGLDNIWQGIAFVEFESEECAAKAVAIDGAELANRKLKIKMSKKLGDTPGTAVTGPAGSTLFVYNAPLSLLEEGARQVRATLDLCLRL